MKKIGIVGLVLLVLLTPFVCIKAAEKNGTLIWGQSYVMVDLANGKNTVVASVNADRLSRTSVIQVGFGKQLSGSNYTFVKSIQIESRAERVSYSKKVDGLGATANTRATFSNETQGATFEGTCKIVNY